MQRKIAAEVLGTFVLVLGGCGSAVLAGDVIGAQGVAIAFGLTVLITILIGTTPAEYGAVYMFFTTLTIGLAIAIWLDKFMGTNLLPK